MAVPSWFELVVICFVFATILLVVWHFPKTRRQK
jgi:hypothetical protein